MGKNICFIPARMASTRFPGKPIKPLLGMSMIEHIAHRCALSERLDRVIVTTCDEAIANIADKAGFDVIMTHDSHPGCVDRVSEAIQKIDHAWSDDDFVLMVQGDEIMVNPSMIDNMIDVFNRDKPSVVNLISTIEDSADYDDPNVVKIVTAADGKALYLSRSCIPSQARQEKGTNISVYQQTGIIGFSKEFIELYLQLPRTPLEKIELIDMLRVLESGYVLQTVKVGHETIGVDTQDDLKRAEIELRKDPYTSKYINQNLYKHN